MDKELVAEAQRMIKDTRRFRLSLNALINRGMVKYGINVPQCTVLGLLAETEEMTMGALSEAIGTTMGAATNLVDRLVYAGHVEREHSKEDRRIVKVRMTSQGRELLDRIYAEGEVYFGRFLNEIKPEDRRTFFEVYEKLTELIRAALLKSETPSTTEPQRR
jgi:DNA-binding MarR family transcriptional regulator